AHRRAAELLRRVGAVIRELVGHHHDRVADADLRMPDLAIGRLVAEELRRPERLLVELQRALGAVDDHVGRDIVVTLGNLLHSHLSLLPAIVTPAGGYRAAASRTAIV